MFAHFISGDVYYGDTRDSENTTSFEVCNLSEKADIENKRNVISFECSDMCGRYIETHDILVCVVNNTSYVLESAPITRRKKSGILSVSFSVPNEDTEKVDIAYSHTFIEARETLKYSKHAIISLLFSLMSPFVLLFYYEIGGNVFLISFFVSAYAYYRSILAYSALKKDYKIKGRYMTNIGNFLSIIVIYSYLVFFFILFFIKIIR